MIGIVQGRSAKGTSAMGNVAKAVSGVFLALVAAAVFAALLAPGASAACSNEAFRNGASAQLPDCRAYELVTPPKVNGFPEDGTGSGAESLKFSSPPVTQDGNSYLWTVNATGLPGTGSSGFANLYQARRSAGGWTSLLLSPKAFESEGSNPGSASRDQAYASIEVEGFRGGNLAFCLSCSITYVRYPDGSFHFLGEGTVPTGSDSDGFENGFIDDPHPSVRWIAPGGGHQIFTSTVQLMAAVPVDFSQVYDRTPSGLELVSMLPGEAPPVTASSFAGSSVNGETVLFMNEGNLYARLDNAETIELASGAGGEILPGGVSEQGSKAFFVQSGNIYCYDFQAEEVISVATPGNATLAVVSPDGSHAYFVSETELIPGEGAAGFPNFYVWDGTSVQFIDTLSFSDLAHPNFPASGLGYWTPGFEARPAALNANRLEDTARTTPDGSVIVFESYEQLTSYPNEGHIEIYRYDSTSGELACVSCGQSPAASADSEFVHVPTEFGIPRAYPMNEVANLSEDGERVVFESLDALLPQDVNGTRDVYQWEAGSLGLISTGQSPQPSGLYAVTPSGDDIFFLTGEKLVGQGQEAGKFAVYDARVNGGLASQQAVQQLDCIGEACQGEPAGQPALATPGSAVTKGKGNVRPRCRHHRKAKKVNGANRKQKKRCRHARRRGAGK
ncbi:MAG TPA: hypothetical protein VNC16_11385 [Solirubrobacterales bacterium]|nr:hypothetical protein [Solirubrobacterales bacterium]